MTAGQGDAAARLPLQGVTVIDLGQVYQGPYATFLLAKAGADVIKVEPIRGETLRSRAAVDQGSQYPFEVLNANKRSIAVDLKSPHGRELLLALARRADVVVENFAPGVMDRLGVGWTVLHRENSRLIYASATGFGLSGPDRDRLAMDLNIQAVSGLMSTTGFPDGPPLKSGAAIGDMMGGVHLYGAIVTALYERSVTGRGRLVEVAMLEAVLPALISCLGLIFGREESAISPRTGNRHSGLAQSPYNAYPASDGYVTIITLNDHHWEALLRLAGREDLVGDPRFSSNPERVKRTDEVDAIVEAWTRSRTVDEIYDLAHRHRIPCAPVRELAEVLRDPGLHERGALDRQDHPRLGEAVMIESPLRFHDETGGVLRRVPAASPELGEHTGVLLRELLGMAQGDIDALAAAGVIGGSA